MADEAKTESKEVTVAEGMTARRIFPNIEEAAAYLSACAEKFSDFESIDIAAPGMDEEGNFDPEIYSDDVDVMVSKLTAARKVKAIVVAPIPRVSALLESEEGTAWVEKILHKELNHVAVRHLRDAEDVTTVIDMMPTSLDAYISSGREGTGGMLETYDELYKQISATIGTKWAVWQKARFTKAELRKALESKGYASEFYPAVEDYKGQSLFETALALGIAAAKRKGLDPTIFERWASTRNDKTYNPAEDEDEEELGTDALLDAMLDEGGEEESETPAPADQQGEETPAS